MHGSHVNLARVLATECLLAIIAFERAFFGVYQKMSAQMGWCPERLPTHVTLVVLLDALVYGLVSSLTAGGREDHGAERAVVHLFKSVRVLVTFPVVLAAELGRAEAAFE